MRLLCKMKENNNVSVDPKVLPFDTIRLYGHKMNINYLVRHEQDV